LEITKIKVRSFGEILPNDAIKNAKPIMMQILVDEYQDYKHLGFEPSFLNLFERNLKKEPPTKKRMGEKKNNPWLGGIGVTKRDFNKTQKRRIKFGRKEDI